MTAPLSVRHHDSTHARLQAVDRFKSQPQGVLVATDVAARGLDIKGIRYAGWSPGCKRSSPSPFLPSPFSKPASRAVR
eukprot:150566-Chlamydomonas_euryale.AAC.1